MAFLKPSTTSTTLKVIAREPFHIHYEGPAEVVSASNAVGPFDVLPGHADFFSMLEPGEVSIGKGAGAEPITFTIHSGIIAVRNDEVMLFVNM